MEFNEKRIFVSGGCGVIGHELVDNLINQGAKVFVGDLKPQPEKWYGKIKYRQGDLNDLQDWELSEFDPEYFIHLAATFERSEETFGFWHENIHHNLSLSSHLMELMNEQPNLKRVVFASSYLIYDKHTYCFKAPQQEPVSLSEDHTISPRNLCGSAKLHHEIELDFLSSSPGTNYTAVCARIYRSYGFQSRDIISRWIRMALKKETLTVFGEESLFDYVFAGDVAEGLLRLATSDNTGIFNLGRGKARRVSEVIDVLTRHFPGIKIIKRPTDIDYEASEACMDKMLATLGWAPQCDIEDTIPRMIEYERHNPYHEAGEKDFSVLVTSASQKISCIKEIRRAHQKTFNQITDEVDRNGKIIAGDVNRECLAKYFSDDFWQMPALKELEVEKLVKFCKDHDVKAIIPTRDGELLYFAQHREKLIANGIYTMVSGVEAIEVCIDKQNFYDVLNQSEFPVIRTCCDADLLDCSRYVVKERFGAGSKTILLNASKDDAIAHSKNLENPIFQPFIDGQEYSVDIYVDRNDNVKGGVVRERNLVIDGESKVTTTVNDDLILGLCSNASKALKLYGHSVWQVLVDEDKNINIIECNPRFGGASSASLAVGLDSFYWFLQEILRKNIDHLKFNRHPGNIRQIRYPENEHT